VQDVLSGIWYNYKMKYFDSHCHLDMEPLAAENSQAIERAFGAGVTGMINVGASLRGSRASVDLAQNYPNIWASVGLHPHDAEAIIDLDSTLEELEQLASNESVVAIGEIGLDYFYLESNDLIPKQKELFSAQLELAKRLDKPIIIHIRDAWDDAFEIIRKSKIENRKSGPGVVHCFTGGAAEATKSLELGLMVGFTGFVTFEQSKFDHIREAVRIVPIEKMLIETDAPFLAPEPHRGRTNEPAYVVEVAKKIAELKGISLEEVAEKTQANAKKLFNIK
jgi:TatD DNase family protein